MWLVLAIAVTARAEEPRIPELEILPGFRKQEIVESARATLAGAATCLERGLVVTSEALDGEGFAYVTARRVDGHPVELDVRRAEVHCRSYPLTRCTFLSAVEPSTPDVAYASVDCRGSRRGHDDRYGLTATRDVQGARGGDPTAPRGDVKLSLSFTTSTFPGTQVSAFAMLRRRDRAVVDPVGVVQFDDYAGIDDALYGVLDAPTLDALVGEVAGLAARAVATEGP